MTGIGLLWLLLPVAAASGWFAARYGARRGSDANGDRALRSDYFSGINYLLNEQPDKAVESFIKVLEVDAETVETHLALGNLYRRRGEVDRAIRIHQNLIARPSLQAEQRSEALLELGHDYLSAGLLDRAENLFRELADNDAYRVQALRQLIDIYEQEKDWEQAIRAAHDLEAATGNQLGGVIANYHCEVAERARGDGEEEAALEAVGHALAVHSACVRASLLEGDLLCRAGDDAGAIEAYRRIETQDPEFLPEAVARMESCFRRTGRAAEMAEYLESLLDRFGSTTATVALADIKREQHGAATAIRFLGEQLRRRGSIRGFHHLLELELQRADDGSADRIGLLRELTGELLADRPVYQCQHCGFPARLLHWQCPSCKHWNTIRPIRGVEGE